MRKIYLFTTLLFATVGYSQPMIEWEKTYGGIGNEEPHCIVKTTDGGYIIAGYSDTNDGDVTGVHGINTTDYWILKISDTGILQWQKSFGGNSNDYAHSIVQTNDGGYIVAGYAYSTDGDVTGLHGNGSHCDAWVIKISDTGVKEWEKAYGGTQSDSAYRIIQTADGGYIFIGSTNSTDGDVVGNHSSLADIWLVKLNSVGVIQWQRTYGGSNSESAQSIRQTTDGGFIIAGNSSSTDGDVTANYGSADMWILKLDDTGEVEWQKTFGGAELDVSTDVEQLTDGSYIVLGYTNSDDEYVQGNHGSFDYLVLKLNSTGVIEWQKTLGGSNTDISSSIARTIDGGFVITGGTLSTDGDVISNHGQIDYWLLKFNGSGTLQWQKTLGGSTSEEINWIRETDDGGFIIAGYTNSTDGDVTGFQGASDFWIVKLFPYNLATTPLLNSNDTIIYPNPAQNFLNISSGKSTGTITVTDLAGRKVIENHDCSGKVNVEGLAPGAYTLQILSDGKPITEKFIKK